MKPERLELLYSAPEMVAQRRATLEALAPQPGERGLELGPGPGHLACEIAAQLGASGHLTAIDNNAQFVAAATKRAEQAGLAERFSAQLGDAAALKFDTGSFDFVVATQVIAYVKDIEGSLREIHRVLKPGGRAVILDTHWGSLLWAADDEERMRRICAAYAGRLTDSRLPARLGQLLRSVGFTVAAARSIPILTLEHDERLFAGQLMHLVAEYLRDKEPKLAPEAEPWVQELLARSARGAYFFSLNRYQFTARKEK